MGNFGSIQIFSVVVGGGAGRFVIVVGIGDEVVFIDDVVAVAVAVSS